MKKIIFGFIALSVLLLVGMFMALKYAAPTKFAQAKNTSTAVQFDAASGSGYQTGASPITWAHTVSGTNRILVVGTSVEAGTIDSITYAGFSLTQVRQDIQLSGEGYIGELWYLLAPPTGTNDIVVTGGSAFTRVFSATSWKNVDQDNPIEADAGTKGGTFGDISVNITTLSNGAQVVDNVVAQDSAITVGANQTQRNNQSGAFLTGAMSNEGAVYPPKTVNMGWTDNNGYWAASALVLKPFTSFYATMNHEAITKFVGA